MSDDTVFLKVDSPKFKTVEEVLGAAAKYNLTEAIVIGLDQKGHMVMLTNQVPRARANWWLDCAKFSLLSGSR